MRRRLRLVGLYVLLLAGAVVTAAPLAWMVSASLMPTGEASTFPPRFLPSTVTLEHYRALFTRLDVARYFLNSALIALAVTLLSVLINSMAGYAFAKLRFRGREPIFRVLLGALVIPVQVAMLPLFLLLKALGAVNTYWGVIIPTAASIFGIFLTRQYALSIPDDLLDAARMDGASELRIIYGLLGPMLRPTLAALFLFSFVFHYNDYFWPLVMTTDDRVRTLPLAIALLREQGTGVRWHIVMAGNVLLSLPVLALFAAAQKHILRAVTARG